MTFTQHYDSPLGGILPAASAKSCGCVQKRSFLLTLSNMIL